MGKLVGAIAAVLVGLALATGVAVAVSSASAPDKGVNLEDPAVPNNSVGGLSADTVDYGSSN
ncbi:MAG TPA: hypothetical protein VNP92_30220 [Actinophytocola sp.]|nr:hypothetical protein [Actinophytocola sp.]